MYCVLSGPISQSPLGCSLVNLAEPMSSFHERLLFREKAKVMVNYERSQQTVNTITDPTADCLPPRA